MRSTSLTLLLSAIVAVTCGGAAEPAPTAPAATTSAPSEPAATAQATAPAETSNTTDEIVFTVTVGRATVAVREQLADRPAPNDAVLVTDGVTGSFTLKHDGTFADDSRIEADLDALDSDSGLRDGFVKRTTLDTSRFPTAVFVPTKAEGLALPLADGPFAFTLTGDMAISGTTKTVTWRVTGEKAGDRVTATATNAPTWKFGDFGLEIPRVFSVLSIVDEIRLSVELEATADERARD